jgi:hypothetical protein
VFRVAYRAPSAPFFKQGESLQLELRHRAGTATLTFQTRYIDKGSSVPLPGDLWVDARGPAPSLEEAVSLFGNAAHSIIDVISFATNSSIGEIETELAFDDTPGVREREFLQVFLPDERNLVTRRRTIDVESVTGLIAALDAHPDKERLLRVLSHYSLALRQWRMGDEILATAHLYMGVETLTKALLRSRFPDKDTPTEQVAASLGIDVRSLDPLQAPYQRD